MKDRGYIQLQCIGACVDSLHGLLQEVQSYNPDKATVMTHGLPVYLQLKNRLALVELQHATIMSHIRGNIR